MCLVLTDPLRHPVTSAPLRAPGPRTAAASRRRPSSQDETGSPQSSDNEHSSGRLQTDTGRGCQSGRAKAINMEESCLPPATTTTTSHPHAGFEAITHNGHIITLSLFFSEHLLIPSDRCIKSPAILGIVCNYSPHRTAQNTDIMWAAARSWHVK